MQKTRKSPKNTTNNIRKLTKNTLKKCLRNGMKTIRNSNNNTKKKNGASTEKLCWQNKTKRAHVSVEQISLTEINLDTAKPESTLNGSSGIKLSPQCITRSDVQK